MAKSKPINKPIDEWSAKAREALIGRDIIDARFLTDKECNDMGRDSSGLVLSLGTKTLDGVVQSPLMLIASNGEGNDSGFVIVTGNSDLEYFPIIGATNE